MKVRADAGTDVAMIAVWDAQRNATPFTAGQRQRHLDTLEADATEGHLFLVHTGGDGGGPVDVYVDERIPDDTRERFSRCGGEFLLLLPSGSLVVGGAEEYRTGEAARTSVAVPPGDYTVRCYKLEDEEQSPPSEEELRRLVGRADLAYYDRINKIGCITGVLTLLLFPVLAFPLGWKVALVVTIVVSLGFFPLREWLLRRNARYQRLNDIVPAFRLGHQDPAFIFELRALHGEPRPGGGSVSV